MSVRLDVLYSYVLKIPLITKIHKKSNLVILKTIEILKFTGSTHRELIKIK